MENSSKIKEWFNLSIDYINEQTWFQQLKSKWEELDSQSQNYVKFGAFGGSILVVILIILSAIWSVHSLKVELAEKKELLSLIQSANDEVRRLRENTPTSALSSNPDKEGLPWSSYFETLCATSGFEKSTLSILSEKAGAMSDQSKETLFEIGLKHVNIKNIIKFIFSLEGGQRPVKLRNLLIDTKGDPSGYLDATLAISAFTLLPGK